MVSFSIVRPGSGSVRWAQDVWREQFSLEEVDNRLDCDTSRNKGRERMREDLSCLIISDGGSDP